jgi:aflatoxin B1 aldehyde reductase
VAAGERFLIDTKVVSFVPGSHAEAKIDASIDASAASLKVSSVNVEYLHVPDH